MPAPRARLFVALDVAEAVRDALDAAVEAHRDAHPELKWVAAPSWHVTLAFVGWTDVPPDEVAAAVRPPAAEAPPLIEAALGVVGHFGRRVLWIAVDDRPARAIATLAEACEDALETAGIPVDRKEVRPHLTLARTRRATRFDGSLPHSISAPDGAWSIDELVVYRSHLGSRDRPTRYEPLARVPLGR